MKYLKLKNGFKVWIEQLNVQATFMNVYAFSRTRENNMYLHKRLRYPSSWGEFSSVKIPPTEEELSNLLDRYFYSIYLSSNYCPSDDADGSHMVIMFTSSEFFPKDMHSFVSEKLKMINWEEQSGKFIY